METQILAPTEEAVALAARILREGGLVGLPTETVYGLGANALDEAAGARHLRRQGPPGGQPAHRACAHASGRRAPVPHQPRRARADGALLPRPAHAPHAQEALRAGCRQRGSAQRGGAHPLAPGGPARAARLRGCPWPRPSANTSGKPSPTTALHVYHDLKGKLPLILDGGECQVGAGEHRGGHDQRHPHGAPPGGITPEMLLEVLPQVRVADSVLRPLREGERALSPGMRYRHYAPGGELTLVKGSQENVRALCLRMYREAVAAGRSARILAFEEHLPDYAGAQALSIGSLEKPETVAHRLFNVLRQMDEEGVEALTCEVLPAEGIGLAIMNRLSRAAAFRIRNADEEADP